MVAPDTTAGATSVVECEACPLLSHYGPRLRNRSRKIQPHQMRGRNTIRTLSLSRKLLTKLSNATHMALSLVGDGGALILVIILHGQLGHESLTQVKSRRNLK